MAKRIIEIREIENGFIVRGLETGYDGWSKDCYFKDIKQVFEKVFYKFEEPIPRVANDYWKRPRREIKKEA